jgi:hypothetical protein
LPTPQWMTTPPGDASAIASRNAAISSARDSSGHTQELCALHESPRDFYMLGVDGRSPRGRP